MGFLTVAQTRHVLYSSFRARLSIDKLLTLWPLPPCHLLYKSPRFCETRDQLFSFSRSPGPMDRKGSWRLRHGQMGVYSVAVLSFSQAVCRWFWSSFMCGIIYNLGQNKMEQQTPIPKSRMKPREGQKRAIFPILDLGGRGGGGGSRFSIYFVQDCSPAECGFSSFRLTVFGKRHSFTVLLRYCLFALSYIY